MDRYGRKWEEKSEKCDSVFAVINHTKRLEPLVFVVVGFVLI